LRVAVVDHLGRPVRAAALVAWLARVAPASAHGDVAVALVSDARIRDLNRRFRRKPTATDVLSFPDSAPGEPRLAPSAGHDAPRLGDLVISVDTARRQARAGGHPYTVELKILALHGLLHLLGYDHDSPSDRGRMARVERRLRAKGGLAEGLIERGTMRHRSRERAPRRQPGERLSTRPQGKSPR
jgi:probable rRNA maturation factor